MRRYSKKHSLVTLSDINLTPMLDLAFVLLIIFVIATPLMEHGMKLDLPEGGSAYESQEEVKRIIEINDQGDYFLDGKKMGREKEGLNKLEDGLKKAVPENTVIYIRVDEEGKNKYLYAVIDVCQRNNLMKFSLRTRPRPSS